MANEFIVHPKANPTYLRVGEIRTVGNEIQPAVTREFLDGPDAVAVLIHCPAERKVLIPAQFRPAIVTKHAPGWIYEIPAGMIDPNESPWMAAVREVEEETGIAIDPESLWLAGRFATSPGRTNEFIYLYIASVPSTEGTLVNGGLPDEVGLIRNEWYGYDFARDLMIVDMKTQLALVTLFGKDTRED
jgi:8-oxo-dGTP pyrophosphatase MutT (NUDIX family)